MSNAFRDFSVVRRRPNLVDILTPKRVGVKGYRLEAAANFDGVFAEILTADIGSGYLDRNVNSAKLHSVNAPNQIRIAFDPVTFGFTDSQHLWLRFVPVDFAGAPGTAGSPSLLLPDDMLRGTPRVVIAGNAPNGAAVANSLVLNLPNRMSDIAIRNNAAAGGTVLFVAMEVGGAERQVAGQETAYMKDCAQGCILVRGNGGVVSFSADFTHFLPL